MNLIHFRITRFLLLIFFHMLVVRLWNRLMKLLFSVQTCFLVQSCLSFGKSFIQKIIMWHFGAPWKSGWCFKLLQQKTGLLWKILIFILILEVFPNYHLSLVSDWKYHSHTCLVCFVAAINVLLVCCFLCGNVDDILWEQRMNVIYSVKQKKLVMNIYRMLHQYNNVEGAVRRTGVLFDLSSFNMVRKEDS